jgi:hypothetical protein
VEVSVTQKPDGVYRIRAGDGYALDTTNEAVWLVALVRQHVPPTWQVRGWLDAEDAENPDIGPWLKLLVVARP